MNKHTRWSLDNKTSVEERSVRENERYLSGECGNAERQKETKGKKRDNSGLNSEYRWNPNARVRIRFAGFRHSAID